MAGFFGGLCIALDVSSRQRALGLYFLCRSLYFIVRVLMRWGWLPRIRNLSVWLFSLANGPIMYSFLFQPALLDKVCISYSCVLVNHVFMHSHASVTDVLPLDLEHGELDGWRVAVEFA